MHERTLARGFGLAAAPPWDMPDRGDCSLEGEQRGPGGCGGGGLPGSRQGQPTGVGDLAALDEADVFRVVDGSDPVRVNLRRCDVTLVPLK